MAWAWGQQKRGEQHHQTRFSDAVVAELRQRVADGESTYAAGKALGFSTKYAYAIIAGTARRSR